MIYKKNICPELLSRAKILPAKYFVNEKENEEDLFGSINSIKLKIPKTGKINSQENYFETTNLVTGKDNKIQTNLG